MKIPPFCPDCFAESGKKPIPLFDGKHQGFVCERCERVFSPHLSEKQIHYATLRGCMRALRLRGQRIAAANRAIADLILKN